MEVQDKTLAETLSSLLSIARRHIFFLVIPFVTIGVAATVIALKLPLDYVSKGTILIEQQQIPQTMINTTVTGFADERIRFIQQRVMTRERILSIIDKYHLYDKQRGQLTLSELVEQFQKNVSVDLIAADVKSSKGGNANKATIAFTIAFRAKQPVLAQSVANELVNLFLAENSRVRTQRATKTTEFISEEAERVNQDIRNLENKIAEFKEKYGRSLPDLLASNLSSVERLRGEVQQTENQISLTKERIAFLTSSLPQVKRQIATPSASPEKAVMTEDEQIRALKSEYLRLSSRYNPTHPDVLRIARQLKSLDPSFTGDLSQIEEVDRQREKTQQELNALQEKYGDDHPDIVNLRRKLNRLEQGDKDAQAAPPPAQSTESSDPVYINLVSQLKTAEGELNGLIKHHEQLQKSLVELNEIIGQTPQVERGYNELIRERETSLSKFTELKAKAQEARLAQTLEEEQKGESFTLIEPPAFPDKPEKGTRAKFFIVGMAVAVLAGVGLAVLAEAMDSSVRGQRALHTVSGIPPLIVIPYIENDEDIAARRKSFKWLWIGLSIFILVAIVVVHVWVMPLDVVVNRMGLALQRI